VLEKVTVTRYVTPLREGGSLPAIVEADNLGTYVLKFRGAGQGPLALVAEIIAGELARRLGLRVPELVLAELDPQIADTEPDQEIQDLLRASEGTNLGLWFDALVQNVDRTWRNPNLLVWHQNIWLIDHGAALYFHHNWPYDSRAADPAKPFDARDHVLKQGAAGLAQAHAALAPLVTRSVLEDVVQCVLPDWFGAGTAADYVAYLSQRLTFMPGVIRA
jgi:hypothetical protein